MDDLVNIDWLRKEAINRGIWLRSFGDIIYLTPPYIIEERDLAQLTKTIVSVMTEWGERAL